MVLLKPTLSNVKSHITLLKRVGEVYCIIFFKEIHFKALMLLYTLIGFYVLEPPEGFRNQKTEFLDFLFYVQQMGKV